MPLEFPWDLIVALGLKCLELGVRLWIEYRKGTPPRPPDDREESQDDQPEQDQEDQDRSRDGERRSGDS